ncbi:MAG: hypothetical protein IPP79_07135 [Chitinophagaceae bacterium]|nr:hypothetical protein [Chitinophagaceae bacterium]
MLIDGETGGSNLVEGAIVELKEILNKIPTALEEKLKEYDAYKQILKYTSQKNEGSHHEKIIIVNGEQDLIGFCGGIDLNNNRIGGFNQCVQNSSKFCISNSDKPRSLILCALPYNETKGVFPDSS